MSDTLDFIINGQTHDELQQSAIDTCDAYFGDTFYHFDIHSHVGERDIMNHILYFTAEVNAVALETSEELETTEELLLSETREIDIDEDAFRIALIESALCHQVIINGGRTPAQKMNYIANYILDVVLPDLIGRESTPHRTIDIDRDEFIRAVAFHPILMHVFGDDTSGEAVAAVIYDTVLPMLTEGGA